MSLSNFLYFFSNILGHSLIIPVLYCSFYVISLKPLKTINYLFAFYALAGILLFSIFQSEILKIFIDKKSIRYKVAFESSNLLFCFAELVAFSGFFFILLKNKWAGKLIKVMSLANIIPLIYFLYVIFNQSSQKTDIYRASIFFNITEMATLFVFCLLFYYTTMQNIHTVFPENKAVLWIVNSLFFYIILNLPFFFLEEELRKTDRVFPLFMYSLHYISLGILYLTIGLAFRTKKAPTA